MRKSLAMLFAAALAMPAAAHDFWLQPKGFRFDSPVALPLILFVGHGPAQQRWGLGIDRVEQFRSFGPDGVVDRRAELRLNSPRDDGVLRFSRPGAYVLAFQSRPAESTLPFLRFNDYLELEGLTPALALRKRTGSQRSDGREIYSRRAKVLVQIGKPDPATARAATRPVGLTLEIVPERNPYQLAEGAPLPVRVLFEGRPLPGALVKLTNLDFDTRPVEMHRSDLAGRASFMVPRHGAWLINVIWTKPIRGNPKADFETTFSSLTFGY